jgi:hypothetical protein
MRRIGLIFLAVLALVGATTASALAGSPHFIFVDVTQSGNTLTVSG